MKRQALLTKIFNEFNGKNIEILNELYEEEVEFVDPVVRVQGLSQLKSYFKKAYQNVQSIQFRFDEFVEAGDVISARWEMLATVSGLNGGQAFKVQGVSWIRFSSTGKVLSHQDYFDLGALVYQRLPVQGAIISWLKSHLSHGFPRNSV